MGFKATDSVVHRTRYASLALGVLFFGLSACTKGPAVSKVTLKIPENASALSFPAGSSLCFGANVSAPDLPPSRFGSCQTPLSIAGGFVPSGGTISLSVPRGSSRTIDLYAYVGSPGEACPDWNSAFDAANVGYKKVFKVGTATGVNLQSDSESVTITASFPGEANNVAQAAGAACSATLAARLRGFLYTNGDVRNSTGVQFVSGSDMSHPIIESFFKILGGDSDNLGIGTSSTSSSLNIGSLVAAPAYVHSVTRRPDTQQLLALLHGGEVVGLDATSGAVQVLSSTTCPLGESPCRVPAWMQSISAGNAGELFGLDHGGKVWKLGPALAVTDTGTAVSPAVAQVSYY